MFSNYSLSQGMKWAELVADGRPYANRVYDQIFMKPEDMLKQAYLMNDFVAGKDIVFLGDGDGMSMLFAALSSNGLIDKPKSFTVLDFDQRIINNINRFLNVNGIEDKVDFSTELYNVIDKLPEKHQEKYNFFYINPPYGSKNNGISCEVWLYRCLELCKNECSGCIVIPYTNTQDWTQKAMLHNQEFLTAHGFVIRDMLSEMHRYYLKDNPELRSASIVVDRINKVSSEFSNQLMPPALVEKLYGTPRNIPRIIYDDGTEIGNPDFNWNYGMYAV